MKQSPTIHSRQVRQVLQKRREQLSTLKDFQPQSLEYSREDETLELLIYDVIGDFWFGGVSALDVAELLMEHKDAETIVVRINSPGGDVFDGVAIFNSLIAHHADVEVQIDGLAASAASLIAMAGNTIRMGQATQLMLHRAWTIGLGNEEDLTATANILKKIDAALASVYAVRSGKTMDEVKAWLRGDGAADGTWFTADEAVEEGLADEILTSSGAAQDRVAAFDVSQFQGGIAACLSSFLQRERSMPKSNATAGKPADEKPADKTQEPVNDTTDQPEPTPANKPQPAPSPSQETPPADKPPAATIAQLEEACPGADSDFIVAQLKAGADVAVAMGAWMRKQSEMLADANKRIAAMGETEPNPLSAGNVPDAKDERTQQFSGKVGEKLGAFAAGLKLRSSVN